MRISPVLLSVVLLGGASVSEAQHCLGVSSFGAGPIRLDGGVTRGESATAIFGGLSAGAPRGPFASLAVVRTNFDEDLGGEDESTTGFALEGGWEVDLSQGVRRTATSPRVSLCPIAGFQRHTAEVSSVDLTARLISAGLALGAAFPASPAVALVPFASLSYVKVNVAIEGAGIDLEDDDDHGRVDLGVGFVFNRIFTLRPIINIPVGEDEGETRFGVTAHINFGSSRR